MTVQMASSVTRRAFVAGGAALLGAGMSPAGALAQAAKYRRWEISDPNMPKSVLTSYKKAIREMLKRDPTDPRNWYRNAFVHVFDCPHGNWWFLVWHRAYLGWFETICRELSGDSSFALPYWDWTKTPRIPASMFEDELDPNNSAFIASFDNFKSQFDPAVAQLWGKFSQPQMNVLGQRGLNSSADFWSAASQMFYNQPDARGLAAAKPALNPTTQVTVSSATIKSALQASKFAQDADPNTPAGFASDKTARHSDPTRRKGILESQPHDNVHGAIGGDKRRAFMVRFLSPVDPIFFLHHTNLDRLWDVWTRRQQVRKRPTLPEGADLATWSDEQFLFFSKQDGQPVTKVKAGEYTTIAAFDYDYSPGGTGEDQVPLPLVAAAPAAAPVRLFAAHSTSPNGGVADVPSDVLKAAAPDTPSPVVEISLNVGPADDGRQFQVLVAPPGGGTPIPAGGITIFGHHSHAGPATFTLPLPENIAAAPTGGSVPLDIRVVPLEAAPAATNAAAAPAAPQVSAIRVRTS